MGIISYLFAMLFLVFSSSHGLTCSSILNTSNVKAKYRFASFNLEKFYTLKPGSKPRSEKTVFKPSHKIEGVIKAIKSIDPDIWVASEIVGLDSLEVLAEIQLEGRYEYSFVFNNNSGQMQALFYKPDLGLEIDVLSHEHLESFNVSTGKVEPAFTHNFPIFIISKKGESTPFLAVAGVHLKSERDKAMDPKSFLKRTQEADLAVEIVKEFKQTQPNVPVVIMGDFNTNRRGTELNGFNNDLGFIDPFIHSFEDPYEMGYKTHSYHDEGGGVFYSSPDRAFIDPMLSDGVIKSRIYRYRNRDGLIRPLPDSLSERNKNPSDHYPIYFDVSL